MPGFGQINLNFCPGMNLLVGANGVGKTRILVLIAMMLLQLRKDISDPRLAKNKLEVNNNNIKGKTLISAEFDGQERSPLTLFCSSYRSSFKQGVRKSKVLTPKAVVSQTDFSLEEFIEWWLGCAELAEEGNVVAREKLRNLDQVIFDCLGWETIFVAVFPPKKNLIVKKRGDIEDVRYLCSGERAVLAIIFDLIRTLAQANPEMENPVEDGKAIVLIDDLDLHLHPKRQRTLVEQLTKTFPKCQFIASTHSPQIISAVAPENITVLEVGKLPYKPDQTLGMDTNWLLKFLMDTDERQSSYEAELGKIEHLIEAEEYEKAQSRIDQIRGEIGEFPRLVRLQTRITRLALLEE